MIRSSIFAGRKVAVFGLGLSGLATVASLRAGGAEVAAWDDGDKCRASAEKAGILLTDLSSADWSTFAALVLAPGVPLTHPEPHWTVLRAQAAGVEVIGDTELFFRERAKNCPDAKVIGITGTNGKSTTTALVAHVLREAGLQVAMGGNIGQAILSLAPLSSDQVYVIEFSSYQLDLTPSIHCTAAALMNLSPDHLDRHGDMSNYASVKARIFANLGEGDTAIIGVDDEPCRDIARALGGAFAKVSISLDEQVAMAAAACGIWVKGGRLFERSVDQRDDPDRVLKNSPPPLRGGVGGGGSRQRDSKSGIDASRFTTPLTPPRRPCRAWLRHDGEGDKAVPENKVQRVASDASQHEPGAVLADLAGIESLRGSHNWLNAAFALALARAVGADEARVVAGFKSFPGLAHRMEILGRRDRVLFVNDSKGTNADAAAKALAAFDNIFWIAGGLSKEGGIEPLSHLFARIKKAYLIGSAAEDFAATLEGKVAYEHCATLDNAVRRAAEDAALSDAPEPVVLLSPACASFDQFKSFELRGDEFRDLVGALPGMQLNPRASP